MQYVRNPIALAIVLVSVFLAIGVAFFFVALHFGSRGSGPDMIYHAIRKGDPLAIRALLDSSPELLDAKNRSRRTPLLEAAYQDKLEIARILVERGADVNSCCDLRGDWNGFNALHFAAFTGSTRMAELLIHSGTSKDAKSAAGETPRDVAARGGHGELVELLSKKPRSD